MATVGCRRRVKADIFDRFASLLASDTVHVYLQPLSHVVVWVDLVGVLPQPDPKWKNNSAFFEPLFEQFFWVQNTPEREGERLFCCKDGRALFPTGMMTLYFEYMELHPQRATTWLEQRCRTAKRRLGHTSNAMRNRTVLILLSHSSALASCALLGQLSEANQHQVLSPEPQTPQVTTSHPLRLSHLHLAPDSTPSPRRQRGLVAEYPRPPSPETRRLREVGGGTSCGSGDPMSGARPVDSSRFETDDLAVCGEMSIWFAYNSQQP